ncbi:glycosyltransferase family 4 protein, partial [bacterium]|nr:glycosyltransferase family 4 protein [bacterium]
MFYPEEQQRKKNKLVVGWAGSLTNHGKKRGFYEYIQPICNEIPEIELKVQAKEDQFITDDNMMRQFYNSLDVYVCASRVEGTPRPVIEAAACGVPIISTDVGIIPELVQNGINGLVVKRDYQAIKEGFLTLVGMRDKLPEMGETIRKKMEKEFNWEHLIYQWIDFFQNALDRYELKQNGLI